MKKCIWFWLGLTLALPALAAEDRVFALATAGDVDAALAERVRVRLVATAGVAVRMAPPVPIEAGQALDDLGRAAVATLAGTDHSVIVLARPLDDRPQGVCLPQERFAVLNLAKLEPGADAARVERRAAQEGLRVLAFLLDMAPCPFPLCVLTGYEKTEDLDRMSGSFCPPCQDRFERTARAAGLRLIPQPEPESEDAAAPAGSAPAAGD